MATLWNALKLRRYDGSVAMPHERTAAIDPADHAIHCCRTEGTVDVRMAVPGKQWEGAPMRHLEKWCRLQREIFRAQLGRLEGHLPSPFNDYHEPLLFADTPVAKEKLRDWIVTIDQLLGG
jgi:hypothetical protein